MGYTDSTMQYLLRFLASSCAFALALALLATPLAAGEMGNSMAANIQDVEGKLIQLAEAIPQAKYDWAPSEGVRSVSQVLMHIASANHFFASRMGGGKPPADARDWEKTTATQKDAVMRLKSSFAVIKDAVKNADLSQATKLFGGRDGTVGDFGLIAVGHCHEHLGQLIAYARSNGVVPPWSQ